MAASHRTHAGCAANHATGALFALRSPEPSHGSSGINPSTYEVELRSAKAAVVKINSAPSERGKTRFDVVSPRVFAPKNLVDSRPRKAMPTASPELAVSAPMRTATG